ncbi:MAG TPA: R3H domain-containing nucleic acid-binding protein [Methylomirabilota bacterium]|nr:R3H domain-containing nucleic acid-binding protein [Methylomirabilota bacterium]
MSPELIRDGQLDRAAAADSLRHFLEEVIRAAHWDLTVEVKTASAADTAEILADFAGRDKELLLERGAELLKALEHLAVKALRLDAAFQDRIHLDCGGYRALRLEELRMTARVAAERVLATRQPFRLNPMSPRERRVVHLALKDMPGVRTESVGTGDDRQVVIHPAPKPGA